MAIQSAISLVGSAKQSAKGTLGTITYGHGVTGGQVMTVDVQQSLEDRTSGNRVSPAINRTAVMCGADFTTRVHAASAGLWLYGALGSIATTGTTTKTHTITAGSDLPYLSVFGKLDSNLYSVRDLKVGDLGLSWSGNDPVEMSVSGMGTVVGYPSTFSPSTDDTYAAYMRPAGGTFTLDVDSATPASANITAGEVTVANNLSEIMLSGTITPDDIMVGRTEVECSFDIIPANMDDWRTILTGTSSGSSASATPVYGSFSVQYTDGTYTLTVAASRVAFTCDFPSAEPGGGPVTLTLAGLCVQPAAGGTPLTYTLTNTVASY